MNLAARSALRELETGVGLEKVDMRQRCCEIRENKEDCLNEKEKKKVEEEWKVVVVVVDKAEW